MTNEQNKIDISELSEIELQELLQKANNRLELIQEEKKLEKKLRKKAYAFAKKSPEYRPDYMKLWDLVKSAVENTGSINADNIEEIWKNGQEEIPVSREELYPCPKCGKISLWVGQFGTHENPKRKVVCDSCDFVYPGEYAPNSKEAWKLFHGWLIRKGYLNPADPTVSIKEMEDYGYKGEGMLPISKNAAKEYYEQHNIQIYILYPDNTEAAVEEFWQIENTDDDALFGIETEDWNKRR